MASRFIGPFFDSGNGISPSDGATLDFFSTATSARKNTFSNQAATIANANPVVADGDGVFPDIFIVGSYKVVLKDKNGVQIFEADPVNGILDSSTSVGVFTTVASMVASTSLSVGDFVSTIGYLSTGDGGDNHYEVVAAATGTADGNFFIDLDTLQAKAIFVNKFFDIRQAGKARDGSDSVATTFMQVDHQYVDSSFPLSAEAGIWTGEAYTSTAINKEFTVGEGTANAPATTLFAFANNNGTTADVVAILGDAVARVNNAVVFGANLIARSGASLTGTRLVGLEIDVEPAATSTPANGSLGIAINAFSLEMPASAGILFGSLSGGKFANGIVLDGISNNGAGLSPQSGTTIGSLINSGVATYIDQAIILSNDDRIKFLGTASTHAFLYNDTANNVRAVLGSGSFVFRDSADLNSLVTVTSTGDIDISGGYKVAGVAGISFSGAITNLTVVNGIVTAAS